LLEHRWQGQGNSVTITDRMTTWRRQRPVLQRASRAAWRLEQAERERSWPLDDRVRVSGRNAGTTRVAVLPDGMSVSPGDVSGLDTVIDFDPASFVLTASGRINAGSAHGDIDLADRFLNAIFRV
jgi:hypothetical protein